MKKYNIILILVLFLVSSLKSYSQDVPFPGQNLGNLGCPASPSISNNTSGATTHCGVSTAGDHIYSFNLTVNADITIDLCGSSFDTQIHLFSLANGNCNAGAIATNDDACGLQSRITVPCLAAGTYVVVVEGFGTATGAYTLNFATSNCSCFIPAPPANDLCANATPLACGTTLNNETTVAASNVTHGTGCAMGNYGVWYSFTGDGNNSTITSTADAGWNHEIAIVSGSCASMTNVSCTDNVAAGGTETVTFTTTNGVNYFVYIGCDFTGNSPGCTSGFDISRTCTVPPPPTLQDCAGGTSICNDSTFVGNSSGAGNVNDLNASNDGCLSGENQTSWYFFEAQTAGTLEFLISPQNGTDDYDFAMWGPYPSGSTPATICPPAMAPVRCSYAAGPPLTYGGTGLQIGAGDQTEGAGGDDIVDELNLNVGDVYILVIDNFTGSGSPFDINFTLSNGLDLNCTQLPVELLSFNGFPYEGYNKLQWVTAAEINNDHFDVEKSTDGIIFKKVGSVQGAGNNAGMLEYEFTDNNPSHGISYYRLKQVDYNGAFEYSNTVAIKQSKGAEVAIFPNPTEGRVNLNFVSRFSGEYTVIVSDLSKVIYEGNVFVDKGNNIINFSYFENIDNGFYFIKVIDKYGNTIKVDKIIKK